VIQMEYLTNLSKQYNFSLDVVKKLALVYKNEVYSVLDALKKPSSKFYVRTNTLKITSDDLISKLQDQGFSFRKDPYFEDAIFIKVHENKHIPLFGKSITVDKQTAEAVLLGSDVYAPGVVHTDKIRKAEYVTVYDPFGNAIGSGIAEMSSKDILTFRKGLAVRLIYKRYNIPSLSQLSAYFEGLLYPQHYPSIITTHALEPTETDVVVDVCAGEGGKTTGLAQLMHNKGRIIAIERSIKRIEKLKENLYRMGIKNVTPIHGDILKISKHIMKPFADKILIDPPCSNLGLRPKLSEEKTEEDILSVAHYQRKIIKSASRLLKPGGVLVYSTCTLTFEENEENTFFVTNTLGLSSDTLTLPSAFFKSYSPKSHNMLRFHPHLYNTIGFFIARFVK